ncbi:MAG: Pr6Pr family membrane protein [Pyrinomonadaceae bacterium]
MENRNGNAASVAAGIVAAACWAGLAIQFYVTQTHPNLAVISPFGRALRFFEYFTILTNLIVAVSLSAALLAPSTPIGGFFSRKSVRTAVAVYIALVGIVYNFVLQGLNDFTGAAIVADSLTHDIVPTLYTIYWFVFVRKGGLTWAMPLWWLAYPVVYLPYILIRGLSTGRYPYPFLDVGELGFGTVLLNSALLTVVFLALGELFVGADKLIARLLTRGAMPA